MYRRHDIPITRNQRVSPEKVRLAKEMRRNMTPSERLLWSELRGSALNGLHFRRQQIVAGFILDFYCVEERLAIEVDGPVHDSQAENDSERDRALAALGIQTLRFKNEEVAKDIGAVLKKIVDKCAVGDLTPHPPSPKVEGGTR